MDIHGNYEGGGVCDECQHNTEGINCETCVFGYFRAEGVLPNATDPCQRKHHRISIYLQVGFTQCGNCIIFLFLQLAIVEMIQDIQEIVLLEAVNANVRNLSEVRKIAPRVRTDITIILNASLAIVLPTELSKSKWFDKEHSVKIQAFFCHYFFMVEKFGKFPIKSYF